MASAYDEFISNFDLNHLCNSEESTKFQKLEPNHEKRRRSIYLLKGRISGTDDIIQKYLAISEDYNRALKAHSVTKEELKQACINYKDIQETCTHLETEKKALIANQDMLLKRASEAENKCNALLSYSNQLQVLVTQLETEKEALTVEKQIDNSKDKMLLLQKEKETMLKDIISFKQVILGKKKKNSQIIKLLNLYSGQKDPDIYTSDESSNEMTNNGNSSNSKRKGDKEILSNIDYSFIDNDSDSSGEHERSNECSGPCVTNLYKNSQRSLEIFESPTKLIDKIKGVDAANNSLKEKEPARSIFDPEHTQNNEFESCAKRLVDSCTSPVFKSVFVDVGTDPIENIKNIEHKEETKTCLHIPLSVDLEEIKEKKQAPMLFEEWKSKCLCLKSDFMIKNKAIHVDSCTSPISELLLLTNGDIDKCANNVNIEIQNKCRIVKSFQESVNNDKHTAEIETQTIKEKLVEVGTSPITDLLLRTRIEIHKPNDIIQESNNNNYPQKRTAEIETQTEENSSIKVKEKKFVEASTNTDKLIIDRLQNAVQMSNKPQKVTAEIETQTEDRDFIILKKFVDSCTSPVVRIRFENINFVNRQDKLNDENINEEQISNEPISNEQDNLIQTHSSQQLLTQEKICLENNSSNNSHSDSVEIDTEVQNILSVMKFNRDLLSPLPTTPYNVPRHSSEFRCSEQQYNALMGGINKILNIVRTSHSNLLENDKRMNLDTNLEESLFGQQYDLADGQFCEEVEEENINISISSNNNSVSEKPVDVVMTEECIDMKEMSNNKKIRTEKSVEAYPNNSVNRIDIIERIATTTITVADEETVNDHQSSRKPHIGLDYLNNITENVQNNLEVNKLTRGESELCTSNYKKNTPNLKKKSKLMKLKKKLITTNKIKKTAPSVSKRVPKICRTNTEDINLATLKQKIAYENAVKVMAELKSNQKVETKSKATDLLTGVLENRVDNINSIESPLNDSKIMTTRSQKARLNRKEENTVSLSKGISLEDDIKSLQKSPVVRKGRKRSADVKLDHLQGSCKRALRSSNDNRIDVSVLDIHKSIASFNKLERQKNQPSVTKKNEHLFAQDGDEEIVSDTNMEQNARNTSVTENSNAGTELTKALKVITKSQPSLKVDPIESNVNIELNDVASQNIKVASVLSSNEIKSDERNVTKDTHIMKDVGNQEPVEVPESDTKVQQSEEIESNPMSSFNNGSPQKNGKVCNIHLKNPAVELMPLKNDVVSNFKRNIVSYSDDLDLYAEEATVEETVQKIPSNETVYLKDNILCVALDRYGVSKIKFAAKKIPESITNKVSQTLEESISEIISSPSDQQKTKMNGLINRIKTFKIKQILSGLIKYLKDPTRKCELFNKIQTGPAPSMTKAEAILLYVIEQLNVSLSEVNFLHLIYKSIEHSLFQLNQSPTFDVIESMSHFYAIMCRYFRNKSRLRCFMLDAMYCLQFKAVPIIKQCLDVCPGVLPYANEHMAKTSLVTCLVYLLHFYKCNDQYNRTQEIRNILSRKYHYQFSEWSETMILEIFRKAIMNLKGIQNDKKMLRIALIILCKRHGTNWCQTKIIQNMLLPLIQNPDIHEKIKQFCVSMLGPLLKPFPANKKAQCESAINQLLHLLKQNPSHEMKEAIYSSLIFVNKHDQERVVQALLSWNPKSVSQDFEEILNDYVMEKPLGAWRRLVTQPSQCT